MEFSTGVTQKETMEISQLLTEGCLGKTVVAFVVLRKWEGLLQTVFENGITNFNLQDLKAEDTVELAGEVKAEERAPCGIEHRVKEVRVLSSPAEWRLIWQI